MFVTTPANYETLICSLGGRGAPLLSPESGSQISGAAGHKAFAWTAHDSTCVYVDRSFLSEQVLDTQGQAKTWASPRGKLAKAYSPIAIVV
mmetsp:Transcript_5292/g.9960  ORF Transcript_5292/g.9960 Transcript_5292/m.9960 type:complete len:91 (-) Transcript_5292:642-914(-)